MRIGIVGAGLAGLRVFSALRQDGARGPRADELRWHLRGATKTFLRVAFPPRLLASRRDVDVVLRCHSIYATTLACHHKTIPSFHQMTGVAGGTTIRCAPDATFGTQALSDNALDALQDRLACLLGQHGQISLGRTLDSTLALGIDVETISRLYVQALTLGKPPVLPDAEMARVPQQMRNMSDGQAPDLDGVNDSAKART